MTGASSAEGRQAGFLIDVLGAPRSGGGMNLYATELVASWAEENPTDRIVVLGGDWIDETWSDLPNVSRVRWSDSSAPLRFFGQFVLAALLARRNRVHAVLSVSPIVSPLIRTARTGCVVHDWRHVRRPEEFSRGQRMYRRLWKLSVRRADRVFAISEKTAAETEQINPSVSSLVVPNGRDHPRRWARFEPTSAERIVVTYAQHTNKRPELVVDAFASAKGDASHGEVLHVVGARGETRTHLEDASRAAGVSDAVRLHDRLSDDEYHGLVQRASLVVLASSDEGFGLPMVEADYFGVPAVLTSDSGVVDLHPNALVADPTIDSLGRQISAAWSSKGQRSAASGTLSTWAAASARIRQALIGA